MPAIYFQTVQKRCILYFSIFSCIAREGKGGEMFIFEKLSGKPAGIFSTVPVTFPQDREMRSTKTVLDYDGPWLSSWGPLQVNRSGLSL